jgi:hypothetical protein
VVRARPPANTARFTFLDPQAPVFFRDYEAMELAADPGLTVITYTAEPGSPAQDALNLLASWAATTREQPTARAHDGT